MRLVDDLDRSEASQTVTFGLDWRVYEVELAEENARRAPRRPRPLRRRCSSKRHRRWPSATLQLGWWLAAVTVTLRLAYLVLGRVLSWLLLLARSDRGWGVAY